MSCPIKTPSHLKDTRETVLEIICRWITEDILFTRLNVKGKLPPELIKYIQLQ